LAEDSTEEVAARVDAICHGLGVDLPPASIVYDDRGGGGVGGAKGRLYLAGASGSADDRYAHLQAGSMGCSLGFLVKAAEPRPDGPGQILRGDRGSRPHSSSCRCSLHVFRMIALGAPALIARLTRLA